MGDKRMALGEGSKELPELFRMALGLADPWRVTKVGFEVELGELHLYLDFIPGSRFLCPECGQSGLSAYDSSERTWRHLNFFQYKCYLHARTPRVSCPEHGVKTVGVPWARPGSGFTLLFEALILTLGREMPMKAMSELVDEWDTRLWRTVMHYVEDARSREDFSQVQRLGTDETAAKRGHNYVTIFADLDAGKVLFACEGKDQSTVAQFVQDFEVHGGKAEQITEATIDMSPAFIQGITTNLPNAEITFDKFHVVKLMNEALDEVRRRERHERPELAHTRYIWLRRPDNLKPKAKETLDALKDANLKTGRAYAIKEALSTLWEQDQSGVDEYFRRWYFWATHSRLASVIKVAKTIKKHWAGIRHYFDSHLTNAALEGINSKVQAAKARAKGYRNVNYFISMIYLLAGKLTLPKLC